MYSDYRENKDHKQEGPVNSQEDLESLYKEYKENKDKTEAYKIFIGNYQIPITPDNISFKNTSEPKIFKSIKVSNSVQSVPKELAKQNKVSDIKLNVNKESVEESIKKINAASQNLKFDTNSLKVTKTSNIVTANKSTITPQAVQAQQIKKDIKNDIKQTFNYHVSVTVNNNVDEDALAQKIANKTMADNKNAILNGLKLAGLS